MRRRRQRQAAGGAEMLKIPGEARPTKVGTIWMFAIVFDLQGCLEHFINYFVIFFCFSFSFCAKRCLSQVSLPILYAFFGMSVYRISHVQDSCLRKNSAAFVVNCFKCCGCFYIRY